MKRFRIQPIRSWYTDRVLQQKMIGSHNNRRQGQFLFKPIHAFFHDDYHAGDKNLRETFGTIENIITTLKNQFLDQNSQALKQAQFSFIEILKVDLPKILLRTKKDKLTICVVPRAKAQNTYQKSQLLFKDSVRKAVALIDGFEDGTNFIVRHTNTQTTHLAKSGHGGDGDLPYPGITKQTCYISDKIQGRDILLIDDLYTETINIDEDALQALLDFGARDVYFYALGKTKSSDVYSQYNRNKLLYHQTLKNTFDCMSQNKSIEQIAEARGLKSNTIIDHIKEIAEILGSDVAKQYRPDDWIIRQVKQAFKKMNPNEPLGRFYDKLSKNISNKDISLSLLFIDEITDMKFSENAINIITLESYKGIGKAWIVKNNIGNKDISEIVRLYNQHKQPNITIESFENKRNDIKKKLLEISDSYDGITALGDSDFPQYRGDVKEGEQPIYLLYKGNLGLLNKKNKNITVIGLLNPSSEIEQREKKLVAEIVKKNVTIISGLALGCDSIAHKQALLGGKTIAILPSPLNNILPAKNKQLACEIVNKGGLIVSEYYEDHKSTMELNSRYKERDRLQALYSDAVVLIASYAKDSAITWKLTNQKLDSGARLAMEFANNYKIPRAIMYNQNIDSDNPMFDLNRELLNKKNISILTPRVLDSMITNIHKKNHDIDCQVSLF